MSKFSIKKTFKGIFKGVGKVFKSVWEGVKKFASSKIGKIIIIAAAIWLGGAAIGAWNSGFASIDGALVATQGVGAGAAAAPAAEAAIAGGAGTAATQSAAAAATGGLAGTAPVGGSVAGVGGGLGGASAAGAAPGAWTTGSTIFGGGMGGGSGAAMAPSTVSGIYGNSLASGTSYGSGLGLKAGGSGLGLTAPAGTTLGGGGFMSTGVGQAISGAAKWMALNPVPTMIGGQMLSSAFSPNQIDANEQQNQFKIDEEQRRQADIDAANTRIAGVGAVPTWSYSGATLPQPEPAGIMGRKLV